MSITDDYTFNFDLNDVSYELTYWLKNKDLLMNAHKVNAILVCAHAARWIVHDSGWEVNSIVLANILEISQDDMIEVLETGIVAAEWRNADAEDAEDDEDDENEDVESNANVENDKVSEDPC